MKITTVRAAELSGVKNITIRQNVRRGNIEATKKGRDWHIEWQEFIRWCDSRGIETKGMKEQCDIAELSMTRTTETYKTCAQCKQRLLHSAFCKRTGAEGFRPKYGLSSYCKKCLASIRQQNTRRLKSSELQKKYGISIEEYELMLTRQNGVCDICQKPEKRMHTNGKTFLLAVDHCHETGKVRGLLCHSCNRALGTFGDSLQILEAAVSYLKKN